MSMRRLVPVMRATVAAMVSSLWFAQAEAVPLANGESLIVRFSLPGPQDSPQLGTLVPSHPYNIANSLHGLLWASQISGIGAPGARITLYNGLFQLGSYSLQFSPTFTTFGFAGPGSLFDFRSGAASDLSSLEDGSIDGLLEITAQSTGTAVYDYSVTNLTVGHALGAQAYHALGPLPVITFQGLASDEVDAVPEPATALLLALPLLGFSLVQTCRQGLRKRQRARCRLDRRIALALASRAVR